MKRVSAFVLLATIVLSSCGPPAEEIAQTMVAATAEFSTRVAQHAIETYAARPTNTATATSTPVATKTPTVRATATAAPPTEIPVPPTQSADGFVNRALEAYDAGDYQKAIDDLSMAIELDPADAEAYNNRGYAYGELGEYQKAVDDLSMAIELDPQLAEAYNNRGYAYGHLGEHQEAITDYNRVLSLTDDPDLIQLAEDAIEAAGAVLMED